jgi:hypothetical protein
MVRELKSGDMCVVGANEYADFRDELVPLDECARTREVYGQEVGLPVQDNAFVQHVRGLLEVAARKADDSYPENPFFSISEGRAKLGRPAKAPLPEGFALLDQSLTGKLDALGLSLLDVLVDTSQWIGWDRHLGPLSGHQGKLREEARRKILTTFAYGTGLGPTQTARNIADISALQPTAPSGTCTKTTCFPSGTSATAAMAASPTTTSAMPISPCSRTSCPAGSGRPSTSSMA